METAIAKWAVLFKIHFWDEELSQRYFDFTGQCATADVWIVADETKGVIEGLPDCKTFRTTKSGYEGLRLACYPEDKVNWYNGDYALLAFFQAHNTYSYYMMIEYDVLVRADMNNMMRSIMDSQIDYVARSNTLSVPEWGWHKSLLDFWPIEKIRNHLLCLSIYSHRAVACLLRGRQDQSALWALGVVHQWPYCEGFVPTALCDAGMSYRDLSAYGSIERYDWWPPYHPTEIEGVREPAFFHPVLSGKQFIDSVLRYPDRLPPETWINRESLLRRKLDHEPTADVVPSLVKTLRDNRRVTGLAALWLELREAGLTDLIPSLDMILSSFAEEKEISNLSESKFCYQSSVSPWSNSQSAVIDASSAVNGFIRNGYAFHTDKEVNPWWMVDLGKLSLIDEIVLFNRYPDAANRSNHLSIWTSINGRIWELKYRRKEDVPFGGINEQPLSLKFQDRVVARFVRLELNGVDYFHLAKVDVLGYFLPMN